MAQGQDEHPHQPHDSVLSPRSSGKSIKTIKRLPKPSRECAARKFAAILGAVVDKNDHTSWLRLLRFSARCLRHPERGGGRQSLASAVNRQLREEVDPPPTVSSSPAMKRPCSDDLDAQLAARVSAKLGEGDFKGAVRLASSEDTLAPLNEATLEALKGKHPPPHPDSTIPSADQDPQHLTISEEDVAQAIRSFPKSSAGGPDGLRPQHLKDMLSDQISNHVLLPALASFVQLVLEGRTPSSIRPLFFGANLTALHKKGGGIRPIAVGCTLRRLVAKIAASKVKEDLTSLLAPRQLGFGIKGGAEAAVHAARMFVSDLDDNHWIVKLDFKNAFNSLRRDKMLLAVRELAPALYPFVHSSYSSPSSLFWHNSVLQSSEGVQQGDPLGPLLFCLSIHGLCSQLRSEFNVWYLDDGSVGGTLEDISHDLEIVQRAGSELGLHLNRQKSEVICTNPATAVPILSAIPGAQVVDPARATLLGSPIGDVASITSVINDKIRLLTTMGERLQHLSTQDALLLLRNSFAIPKLLYTIRSSPSFLSPSLQRYDEILRSIVSDITNINLDETAWTQASLPVKSGGLGIRSAVQLAPSAFLASAAASSDLTHHILPPRFQSTELPYVEDATKVWSMGLDLPPPSGLASHRQKAWDAPKVSATADTLLKEAPDAVSRSRLLAASSKESGAWLNALPVSSLGLRMDNNTVRIAVGLRLGSPLCRPHTCHHCGVQVEGTATHGLSCKWSEGRHQRHAAVNDIVHCAMSAAHLPSRLEPTGLFRSDGKRPDGVTLVPWRSGRLLVWDATCPDTFAPSHLPSATREAGAVAAQAERSKREKYSALDQCHTFTPVAIETAGPFGPETFSFLRELGCRLKQVTGEAKSFSYLRQRLSIAVQRGNAASVMGTMGGNTSVFDFFS